MSGEFGGHIGLLGISESANFIKTLKKLVMELLEKGVENAKISG